MKSRRTLLLTLLALLLVVGIPMGLLVRELHPKKASRDLIEAIKQEITPAALMALKNGADPNTRDHRDDEPRSLGEEWKRWVGKVMHPAEIEPDECPSALILLLLNEQPDIRLVQTLLEAGANPNAVGYIYIQDPRGKQGARPFGGAALHLACSQANVQIVTCLLRHHANVNLRDRDGRTPLDRVDAENYSLRDFLQKSGAKTSSERDTEDASGKVSGDEKITLLMLAAERNDVTLAKELLQRGTKVNARDESGHTALHYAAQNNNVSMVKLLLDKGANARVIDENGHTPLTYALVNKEKDNKEVVKLLRAAGAKE